MSERLICALIAMAADAVLGEPPAIWRRVPHPVVLIGRLVKFLQKKLNRGKWRFCMGAIALILLIIPLGSIGIVAEQIPYAPAVIAAILLAHRSLVDHVAAVAKANNIEAKRLALGKIVGRDTALLEESELARTAIESAAENLSDAVVAPLFWFIIAGTPGLLIYKGVNTADSEIGYRHESLQKFGWASARLDDVLNFFPARITAAFISLVCFSRKAFVFALSDAEKHLSVNAGWPEAAMAGALNVALGGPRSYRGQKISGVWLNEKGRVDMNSKDIFLAIKCLWRVWSLIVVLLSIAIAAIFIMAP